MLGPFQDSPLCGVSTVLTVQSLQQKEPFLVQFNQPYCKQIISWVNFFLMEVYVVKLLESPGLKDEFKSESERNKSNKELDLFFPIT